MAIRTIHIDTEIMRREIAATIRLIPPKDTYDETFRYLAAGLYFDDITSDFRGDLKCLAESTSEDSKAITMQALARAIVNY